MSINSFEHEVAQRLGLNFDYDTDHTVFAKAVAGELVKKKGSMSEVIEDMRNGRGMDQPREIAIKLRHLLSEAGDNDQEIIAELGGLETQFENYLPGQRK